MTSEAKEDRLKVSRIILIVFALFVGLGALAGGLTMLIDPSGKAMGMDGLLPYFQVLPLSKYLYQDFVFPGIALLVVNCITNLIASFFLFRKKKAGYLLGMIFGITLMAWITIQFCIFPLNWLDIVYFLIGFFQMVAGIASLIFFKQTTYSFSESDYPDVQKDSKTLVLYFSRMGYTKKKAYEIADKEKAKILEIKTKEHTENTSGFFWCGRFGLHRWRMETLALDTDLSSYDRIILVSPVWVFHVCGPIRDVILKNEETLKAKQTEVVLNHFMQGLLPCTLKEVRKDLPNAKLSSFSCHYGKMTEKKIKD
jgi:hypothetical protein